MTTSRSPRWLVTGASGLLGRHLCRSLSAKSVEVVAVRLTHPVEEPVAREAVVDLTRADDVAALVAEVRPDVVLHAAGLTDVDGCERDPGLAHAIHVEATGAIAAAAAAAGARLVHISTDHLWPGDEAMVEEPEPTAPVNVYGRTKAAAEAAALTADPTALIVRTNFFGAGATWGRSLSDWVLGELAAGREVRGFDDVHFTPIHVSLLADLLHELANGDASGLLHVCGSERVSKFEFARRLARAAGLPDAGVVPTSIASATLAAPRPRDMSLATNLAATTLGRSLPDLDQSLEALLQDKTNRHD